MQFSGKEDIDAPIAQVFESLTDSAGYERLAIRRGIEVVRLSDRSDMHAGMAWKARFRLRGRKRELNVELETYTPPKLMRFAYRSEGIEGVLVVELMALSPRRTRMSVIFDLRPRSLSARLLIQSLRLAKSALSKRFKLGLADFVRGLEERLARQNRPGSAG